MTPYKALKLIKNDVKKGKYNKKNFENLVYSLA